MKFTTGKSVFKVVIDDQAYFFKTPFSLSVRQISDVAKALPELDKLSALGGADASTVAKAFADAADHIDAVFEAILPATNREETKAAVDSLGIFQQVELVKAVFTAPETAATPTKIQ